MYNSKDELETYSKGRKQLDKYITYCYKSDSNATQKAMAVRAAMMSFMDQKWKDLVQEKLDKATTVKEMNKIMADEMDVIWPKYKKKPETIFPVQTRKSRLS